MKKALKIFLHTVSLISLALLVFSSSLFGRSAKPETVEGSLSKDRDGKDGRVSIFSPPRALADAPSGGGTSGDSGDGGVDCDTSDSNDAGDCC